MQQLRSGVTSRQTVHLKLWLVSFCLPFKLRFWEGESIELLLFSHSVDGHEWGEGRVAGVGEGELTRILWEDRGN